MNKTEELKKELLDEIDEKLISWHIIYYKDDEWDEDGVIIDFIGELLQQYTAKVSRESNKSAFSAGVKYGGNHTDKNFNDWLKEQTDIKRI